MIEDIIDHDKDIEKFDFLTLRTLKKYKIYKNKLEQHCLTLSENIIAKS